MIYLSQLLGKPVIDADGERIGTISDIAIATGEVFPRVTSLAFKGPDKTPFMLSWRKYVADLDEDAIKLNEPASSLRFSYLQSSEILLSRDLLNKQIVDTHGMKVVRVNDLKLSDSGNALRLLGAEVGMRGLLRAISPRFEKAIERLLVTFGKTIPETLIAWNYMDLLEHDLSQVKLSVTHKRLHELHPADVADILEQLAPNQRAAVFTHLDNAQAAETISELEEEYQADVIEDLSERRASDLLAEMDPDDAADIIADLDYDKAERLLRLMGMEDSSLIRSLLGYREKTAGGIMTPEVMTASESTTVSEAIALIRDITYETKNIHYVYVVNSDHELKGVVSLRQLIIEPTSAALGDIMERDLFVAHVDDDQEDVAEIISKYDILSVPVVDDNNKLLGIVTIDDALDVLEEEAEEDLVRATGRNERESIHPLSWLLPRRSGWVALWLAALFGTILLVYAIADYLSNNLAATQTLITRATLLASGAQVAFIGAILLPLSLVPLEEGVIRGMQELLDTKKEERASIPKRFAFGMGLGAATGLFAGVATFGLTDLYYGNPEVAAAYGVCAFFSSLITSLVMTAFVNRIVTRDDDEKPTSPSGYLLIGMLINTILIIGAPFALFTFVPALQALALS